MKTLEHLAAYGFKVNDPGRDLKDRRVITVSAPDSFKIFVIEPTTPLAAVRQIVSDLQKLLFNVENGFASYGLTDPTPERHDKYICKQADSIGVIRGYDYGEWDRLRGLCRTDAGRAYIHGLMVSEYHREEAAAGMI